MKWGLNHSKFWSVWYNAGLITTIILLPVAIIIILKMTLDDWMNNSMNQEQKGPVLDVMVNNKIIITLRFLIITLQV